MFAQLRAVAAMLALAAGLAVAGPSFAQGAAADYDRAEGLKQRLLGLAYDVVDEPYFTTDSSTLIYRKSVKGGYAFVAVDLARLTKGPAFDHARLAEAMSRTAARSFLGSRLPFTHYTLAADKVTMEFEGAGAKWRCTLNDYVCKQYGKVDKPNPLGPTDLRHPLGQGEPAADKPERTSANPVSSPDQRLEAYVRDWNVFVRDKTTKEARQLSFDGSPSSYYLVTTTSWSPDSRLLAVSRIRPGAERYVDYIESSPADQKQPKLTEMFYIKPGDVLADRQPVLFDVASGKTTVVDRKLFPNAYWQSEPEWWKDGRGFYISYNQRGHQAYKIIEVNREGQPRAIIDEESKTYFEYSAKRVFEPVNDGKEIIWMSERDGWCHLYLYDGVSGRVKNQITKGEWAVRQVLAIDRDARTITFAANGMRPGENPYFIHVYRINFDGTGLIALTDAPASHAVLFSPNNKFYIDMFSRVDMAPVAQLRRALDGKVVMDLEKGDIRDLVAAGWRAPEPFVAKGRDGTTDIYGVIIKPTNFDPAKKYPVIENIYAGPQAAYAPTTFAAYRGMAAQAELGFIVVQLDGMGTSYRSKAFHDVSWMNLADGGFPDRILWHKAAAAKFPWYDISKGVGIYGGSAGGQNAMAALLFHGDFYKAAVAFAGSHDNRMDKIWWNEQYMGWPIGPQYSASSNVDNAWRLQGALMLVVGELDTNVDPSSTMQVADALIKAGKVFDFLYLPGQGHTEGGAYGERKRWDFFVKHLMNVDPPDRNSKPVKPREQDEDEFSGAGSSAAP